jgi:hypothetical protein
MGSNEVAAGLIGAGGAVLAQVVANFWSARRDSRRFAWERDQAAERREEAEGQKFSERRLDLFVALLELIRQTEEAMRKGSDQRGAPRQRYEEWQAAVAPIMAEVQIVAPKVYVRAQSVYNALNGLFVALEQSHAGGKPFSSTVDGDVRDSVRDLRITMRKTLKIPGDDWQVIGPGGNLEPID